MARRICLNGCWSLEGILGGDTDVAALKAQVPGLAYDDLLNAGILPDVNKEKNAYRLCEWIEHRRWRYTKYFDLPKEGKDGSSEKYFIDLPATPFGGCIFLNETVFVFDKSLDRKQFDVTGCVFDIGNRLSIELDPKNAGPLFRKPGFAAPIGLGSVYFIGTSFLSINKTEAEFTPHEVKLKTSLQAYVRGNFLFRYRLFLEDMLAASKNELVKLNACETNVEISLPITDPQGRYSLLLSVERGGIRCDSIRIPLRRKPKWQSDTKTLMIDIWNNDTARFDEERWLDMLTNAKSIGAQAIAVPQNSPMFTEGFDASLEKLGLFRTDVFDENTMLIPEKDSKNRYAAIAEFKDPFVKLSLIGDEIRAEAFGIKFGAVFEIRAFDRDGRELFKTYMPSAVSDKRACAALKIPSFALKKLAFAVVNMTCGGKNAARGELLLEKPKTDGVAVSIKNNRLIFENTCCCLRGIDHIPAEGIYDGRDFVLLLPMEKRAAPLYYTEKLCCK